MKIEIDEHVLRVLILAAAFVAFFYFTSMYGAQELKARPKAKVVNARA